LPGLFGKQGRFGTHNNSDDLIDNLSLKIGHWQMREAPWSAERQFRFAVA
jgi:hypothetical protein